MLTRTDLEQLCDALEVALAGQGIALTRPYSGTITPTEVRINVPGGHNLDAAALSEALGFSVQVRPAPGGFIVSFPRPDRDPFPVRLSPLLRGLRNVPPVTAVLGITDDGAPLLIRLSSPDVRHILVTGPAGCGKSSLLRTIAISASYFTPDLGVGLSPAPSDLARFVAIRQRLGETWPPVVAFYDSLPANPGGLGPVLQDGGGWNVHVILATRHPAGLGGLVDLFPVRIVGTQTPGDFTAYCPEGQYRFWAAWPDVDLAELHLGRPMEVADGRLPASL